MVLCGIDEVGRGPLAGPVTAAAVAALPANLDISELADSKVMSRDERERVYTLLQRATVPAAVGWAWPEEIDTINIHRATLLAMRRAFLTMKVMYRLLIDRVLIDGKFAPDLGVPAVSVVGGDGIHPEIMAASIVAKVTRDRWMTRYSWIETEYGYDRHKGYPTPEHRRKCADLGPSPIQRMSFHVSAG